jgi:hypothetical protein
VIWCGFSHDVDCACSRVCGEVVHYSDGGDASIDSFVSCAGYCEMNDAHPDEQIFELEASY